MSTRKTVTFARETAPPGRPCGSLCSPACVRFIVKGHRAQTATAAVRAAMLAMNGKAVKFAARKRRGTIGNLHAANIVDRHQVPESCAKEGSLWRRNATDDLQRTNGLDARKDHFAATRHLSGQGGDVHLMSDQ
jgi:hypothetical protein